LEPSVIFIYVGKLFLIERDKVSQPINKVNVILWEHDGIQILIILGDIEAKTEFFPRVAPTSPLEKKQAKIDFAKKSRTPERSFLGHNE
jgi:hypothetical protein